MLAGCLSLKFPLAIHPNFTEIYPMTRIIRLLPLFLLLLVAAPATQQVVATPVPTTIALQGFIPQLDLADPRPNAEDPSSEATDGEEKTEKSAFSTYVMYGAIGLIVILLIWFFVIPFFQGLAGKGPKNAEKKD